MRGALRPRLPRWPCELCGAPAGHTGICAGCRADLPWIGPACRLCARPLAAAGRCAACREQPPPWSRAVALLAWRFPVDALISRFKYGGALHLGALLGRLLAASHAAGCDGAAPDGLVPVPLHPSRLAERGFNQAQELARPVAARLRVPVLAGACTRVLATPPQAALPAQQRYRNLEDAFAAAGVVAGRRLVILDDVLTTGSTAQALARALLGAGAASIEVWTVARGGTAQAGANR